MKKYIITLSLFFALGIKSFSGISVYFFQGKVEVIEKSRPSHQVVSINEKLSDDAGLRLAENAEVILRDAAGQFAIIHKAGEFTSAQIKEQFISQQGKSLVSSLSGFIGSQLTNSHDDIRKMSESYMKQKGGVSRSGNVYPLMLWPTYGSVSETNKVKFIWNAMPKVSKYEFVIYGGEDANNPMQLSKTFETDTFMDVDFSDFGLTKDAYFSWVVYPEGDPNYSRSTFKIATAENVKQMMAEAERAASQETTTEEQLLMKALTFEKSGLITYADKTYKELLSKTTKNTYKEFYTLFQLRNNLIN